MIMATIKIKTEDRVYAEKFLETFLSEVIPDADFSKGSITRDHTIAAVSAVYALLRQEASNVRNATSLRRINQIEDPTEYAQAVEGIVSNWLISRRPGRKVIGTLTLYFRQAHDGVIPHDTRFVKQMGLVFKLNHSGDYVYRATDMTPRVDARGENLQYALRVTVIAEHTGTTYEVEEGPFTAVTPFSSLFMYAENENSFTGASDPETTEELLARVPGAVTKRDLSTSRSIEALLLEEFPAIDRIEVQGMGDPAMQRDVLDEPSSFFKIHMGGCTDIYVSTPILPYQNFEAEVGGFSTDVRQSITLFRDATIADWRAVVEVGDIIHIRNALTGEPSKYIIVEVTKHHVRVNLRQPFPDVRPTPLRNSNIFTDVSVTSPVTVHSVSMNFTLLDVGRYVRLRGSAHGNDGDYRITAIDALNNTATFLNTSLVPEGAGTLSAQLLEKVVAYSIGSVAPDFDNKVRTRTTGEFSRSFREDGCVLLPNQPVYAIREVSVHDPTHPQADVMTERVYFTERVNQQPVVGNSLTYQIYNDAPLEAQSSQHMQVLRLKTAPERSGVRGTLNATTMPPTFRDAGAVFHPVLDVGKTLTILDAHHEENVGECKIVNVLNATTVEVDRDGAWTPHNEARLHWDLSQPDLFNGKPVRVVYDTLSQFDTLDTYTRDANNSIVAANTLVRGFHPVYLTFHIRYTLRHQSSIIFNEDEAIRHLVSFINSFDASDIINVSDIISEFCNTYADEVGSAQLPMRIDYTLTAPDGRLIRYSTQDAVTIDPLLGVGTTPSSILEDPASEGVTPQTIRYLTDETLITLTQVR